MGAARDVVCVKFLHHIATVLGIWPPYKVALTSKILKLYRIYSLVIASSYIAYYWFSLITQYKEIIQVYSGRVNTCVILLYYLGFWTFMMNSTTQSYSTAKRFNSMIDLLEKYDLRRSNTKTDNRIFYAEAIALKALPLLQALLLVEVLYGYQIPAIIIVVDFIHCYSLLVICLIFANYVKIIGTRLKHYNILLASEINQIKSLQRIIRLRRDYVELKKIIKECNGTFGTQILCSFAVILITYLQLVNDAAVLIINSEEKIDEESITRMSLDLTMWAIVFFVSECVVLL